MTKNSFVAEVTFKQSIMKYIFLVIFLREVFLDNSETTRILKYFSHSSDDFINKYEALT